MSATQALPARLTVQGKAVRADIRQQVLEDAKQRILAGETIEQIATSHGIAPRTLDYWLANLGDDYTELRKLWVDNLLAEAGELLKDTNQEAKERDADAGLRLARAREMWKRATWYAERRDSARYGQKQEVQHTVAPVMHIHLSQDVVAAPALPAHASIVDAQVIDSK